MNQPTVPPSRNGGCWLTYFNPYRSFWMVVGAKRVFVLFVGFTFKVNWKFLKIIFSFCLDFWVLVERDHNTAWSTVVDWYILIPYTYCASSTTTPGCMQLAWLSSWIEDSSVKVIIYFYLDFWVLDEQDQNKGSATVDWYLIFYTYFSTTPRHTR